jgi:hypothetical protein
MVLAWTRQDKLIRPCCNASDVTRFVVLGSGSHRPNIFTMATPTVPLREAK